MRGTAVLFVGLVVFAVCLPASTTATATAASPTAAATQIEPDDVLLQVGVHPDGNATWTVEYRVRLSDDNTTAAFESVQEDIANNATAYAAPFAERMRATAEAASNSTGREMTIRNVTVSATRRQLPQEYGVVTYRFEWTNFAATSDGTLRVGDALSGFFLDGETTLLVTYPDGYEPTRVVPEATERRSQAVVWSGPTDFTTGEPRIVLEKTAAGGGDTGGTADDTPTSTPAPDAGGNLGILVAAGVLGALLAAGAAWYYWRSRGGPTPTPASSAAPAASDPEGPSAEAAATADATTGAPTDGEVVDAAATDAADEGVEEADETPEPPEDLLSNEERVRRLLRQRGGRMKQQEVAEALDWSAAKTSQVITKMREDEELESFRLGRENVLSLPDGEEGESE